MSNGVICAILAAVLFGVTTPLAKSLLPQTSPMLMAGLLYAGSGVGLGIYSLVRRFRGATGRREASIGRQDIGWLAAAIGAGGVVGPALLMWGLVSVPASNASLLLNLEGVLTAVLAWFVFKENFDRRIALGMMFITAGGVCVSWSGWATNGVPWNSIAIVGACLAWAVDNNLTRKVSGGDPVQIAMLKGLAAGGFNTTVALAFGAKLPSPGTVLTIGLIGFLGYGVSLTLFVLALRHIGTARTGAYFATSPFVGAAVSLGYPGEPFTYGILAAAVLMAIGVWLHLTEHHEHVHRHEPMEHEHLHVHDEHHQHSHGPGDPPGEPHSHWHRHEELVHTHPHYPDLHHRHKH